MDDGDSHPASESNNQVHRHFLKHNLRPFRQQAMLFCALGAGFIPGTRGMQRNLPCYTILKLVEHKKGVHNFWRFYCKSF